MKSGQALHYFKSWTTIHKVHFILLMAGFIILLLQIIYGYLVERQLYFEPEPWIKIPLPDFNNMDDLTWRWSNPKRDPLFVIVVLINLLPVIFIFLASLALFNLHRKKKDHVLRAFLFFTALLTSIEMFFILSNSLDLPGYGWYQKLIGGDSWQMQALKATEWQLYRYFTYWTILIICISVFRYIRKKSPDEKPPVPSSL